MTGSNSHVWRIPVGCSFDLKSVILVFILFLFIFFFLTNSQRKSSRPGVESPFGESGSLLMIEVGFAFQPLLVFFSPLTWGNVCSPIVPP